MRMDDRRGDFAELQTARALVPSIVAERDVIAANQELPIELTKSLTGNGLFRMLLPEFLDGPQLPLTKFIRCVEVIAEADGSTGWCVGQGGVFANLADRMPRETADEIWGANPGAVVATGTPFGSTARATANGYELSGRWRFASGCTHASWFGAMANVVDSEGKVVGFGMFMVSRADINLGGGWNVNGLRGTGSREYTLSGHQVPAARAMLGAVLREHCGVATGLPAQLIFASGFGSVGLGIARHALDSLIDLIHGKTPTFSSRKMLDDDMVHVALAQAEARWGASRAFLHEAAEAVTYHYEQHETVSSQLRAHLRLAATSAMRNAGKVVHEAYSTAGSDAIFDDHPLHQCFQDIHALTQQIQARQAHYRTVGRTLLGLEPDAPMV